MSPKLKGCLRSKTMWFSMALAVFGVLEASTQYFQDLIAPKHFGFFVVAVGAIAAILRVITTAPLGEK